MDDILKFQLELSEANVELRSAIADDKDEGSISKLSDKVQACERALQDCIKEVKAKANEVSEPVETKDTTGPDVSLRNFISASVEGRAVQGAEKELLDEKKLSNADGFIPWEAIASAPIEVRADASTTVAAAAVGANQNPVLARVFNKTAAMHLGVSMPMVAQGEQVYPVMTGGDAGAVKAVGVGHDAVKAVFAGTTIKPTRLTARYVIRLEDIARFNVGLEDVLRNDLSMALGTLLDSQVINGDGTGSNFTGILKKLEHSKVKAAAKTSVHADYVALASGGVDGKYAGMLSDVRCAIPSDVFSHAVTVVNAGSGESSYEYLQRVSGGILVTAQLPALSGLRTSMGSDAITAIWDGGLQVIRDPYSGAASGEVALTVHMLAGFALLRTDGWKSLKFKID